jgi:hypothetical protein
VQGCSSCWLYFLGRPVCLIGCAGATHNVRTTGYNGSQAFAQDVPRAPPPVVTHLLRKIAVGQQNV